MRKVRQARCAALPRIGIEPGSFIGILGLKKQGSREAKP